VQDCTMMLDGQRKQRDENRFLVGVKHKTIRHVRKQEVVHLFCAIDLCVKLFANGRLINRHGQYLHWCVVPKFGP
jgi:hypothetical protein